MTSFDTDSEFLSWISFQIASGAIPPRDIAQARTLPFLGPVMYKYKVRGLENYRDRLECGLEPMYDYFTVDGFFFRFPKTQDQIHEFEQHVVYFN